MKMFIRTPSFLILANLLFGFSFNSSMSEARADQLILKHGGIVRGTLESPSAEKTDNSSVSIRTLSGVLVTVPQPNIAEIKKRPLSLEQYELRASKTAETVEAQWGLAQWCRKNDLAYQWLHHLEQVLELDPQHLLAQQTLSRAKNAVQKEQERQRMLEKGLVSHKGKYVTPKEKTLLDQVDQQKEREQEWWKKVKLWHRWLANSSVVKQQNGVSAFRGIKTADALPALEKYLLEDQSVDHRLLYAEVLPNIADPRALVKLVELSLYDEHFKVRQSATENIPSNQVDEAVTLYLQALKHPNNQVIRRAANVLKQLGDIRVVPYLIESLSSTHTFKVRVPVGNSYNVSVNRGGAFGVGNPFLPPEIELGLRTGQYPYGVIINDQTHGKPPVQTQVVNVTRDLENGEVLSALKTITKENFGYNKLRWRSWWNDVRNGKINITPGNQSNS